MKVLIFPMVLMRSYSGGGDMGLKLGVVMYVPLSKGFSAMVDLEDYEEAMQYKWYAAEHDEHVYAQRTLNLGGKTRETVYLHTFLTGWPRINHINGNGLDNRRQNLRSATNAEIQHNRRLNSNSTSGYKGVSWHKSSRKWRAYIQAKGKLRHLGLFLNAEDAAKAYDFAATMYFGKHARLNFPQTSES